MMDYTCLSFDCYGTLIDWESGILEALRPLSVQFPSTHPLQQNPAALLHRFMAHEGRIQVANPTARYSTVLASVYHALAEELSVCATEEQAAQFASSIANWPVFPDTLAALEKLKRHYKLVILSNIDRASFAATNAGSLAGFPFDAVYTAEEIGSYKPDQRNFRYLVDKCKMDLDVPPEKILHTAYALVHDLAPARKAGLAGCWIERKPNIMGGDYEELKDIVQIRYRFANLAEMAEYVEMYSK